VDIPILSFSISLNINSPHYRPSHCSANCPFKPSYSSLVSYQFVFLLNRNCCHVLQCLVFCIVSNHQSYQTTIIIQSLLSLFFLYLKPYNFNKTKGDIKL
jgi:hypothetical protein